MKDFAHHREEDRPVRIELRVQLKITDLYEVYVQQALVRALYGRMAIAVALIVLFAIWEDSVEFLRPLLISPLVYVIVGVFLYSILVRPYMISRTLMRTLNGGSDTSSYVFSETGVDVRREHYEGHYDWAAIRRAKQSPHLLVLYTDSSLALILPKRCFVSAQQLSDFRTMATNQVKRRNVASGSPTEMK